MPKFYSAEIGAISCDPEACRPSTNAPDIVGVQQARTILQISRNTLYRRAAAGEIPGAFKVLGRWKFRRADLVQFARGAVRVLPRRRRYA
ncbi:MAG: helix-turn-helix domain-containing protein [Planctomycetes bacterium]|nr:helix-turn-helix domain-containing protein [Planctomycetota bacterium]